MIGRYVSGAITIATLLVLTSIITSAQTGELRGQVFMRRVDAQEVPLAGADIDVFRTDMSGKYNAKTNKKGEFVFVALPYLGRYVVAASHPSATPGWIGGVRVGQDPVEIIVTPGDGQRLTYDEIKAAMATAPASAQSDNASGRGPARESADYKANLEELKRKNDEIEASNRKLTEVNEIIRRKTEVNEIIRRTFRAGNEALTAASAASKAHAPEEAIQKYTTAVAQYDEGLAANAEDADILNNKAVALKGRGVERYNAAVVSHDDAAREGLLRVAKDDFKAAAEASAKAVAIIKAQGPPTDPAELQRYNGNKYIAMLTYAASMRLYVGKGRGSTESDAGTIAFKEYIAIEPDPAKKAKARLDMAEMLLDSGEAFKALVEFQAILATQPDNPEANLGAGLAIYGIGGPLQEVAQYLQHFIEVAPDTNFMKERLEEAKAILQTLKEDNNVTPQKTKPIGRRP